MPLTLKFTLTLYVVTVDDMDGEEVFARRKRFELRGDGATSTFSSLGIDVVNEVPLRSSNKSHLQYPEKAVVRYE